MFDRAVLFLAWLADSWLIDAAVSPDKAMAAANTGVFYSAMTWLLLDTNWPYFTTSFPAKDSLVTGQEAANTGVFYNTTAWLLLTDLISPPHSQQSIGHCSGSIQH